MNTDKHIQFISRKIADIKVALFHCHSTGILKIPTCVINTFKVTEEGDILIFMARPMQELSQFEKEFPVSLNYFKKGESYFVNIFGKARIINDPEELYAYELSSEEMNNALNKEMLIRVQMLKADYYERNPLKTNTWLSKIKDFVYNSFAPANHDNRSYDFSSSHNMHGFGF